MLNMFKMVFFSTLVMGSMITISSNSWLGMWMGLEINLLSIIPLMNNGMNPRSSEASLKYFITQAMASIILLMSILMIQSSSWTFNNLWMNELPSILTISSLATKMGVAPFHFWLPEVIEGLSWMNSLILLTWQKLAPFSIMFLIHKPLKFLILLTLFCMMVSGILGMNQVSLRKILAYSSINHMGWMIACLMFNQTIWIWYFLIYSTMNILIIWMFWWMNSFYINQMSSEFKTDQLTKITFMMNFLSLGGIPPFIGFLPKWLVIQAMTSNNNQMIAYLMIVMTLMTIYFYLRMSIPALMLSTYKPMKMKKLQNPNFKKTWFYINNFFLLSLSIFTFTFNWM